MGPPKKIRGNQKRKELSSPLSSPSAPSSPDTPVRDLKMDAQIKEISTKLSDICEQLSKIDRIESRLERVETALCELKHENTAVREELASARFELEKKDKIISTLSEQVNRLDQSARQTSLRIMGLPINASTPPADVPKIVFAEIVAPCLEAARAAGEHPTIVVPYPSFLIDSAFTIPSKKNSQPTVIVKLSSVFTRNTIFRYKKTALPKIQDAGSNKQRNKYAVFEDLSPMNHNIFHSFASDSRVKSTWTYNGQVRFKTHDSDTIYKVRNQADTYDSLVKPTKSAAMET